MSTDRLTDELRQLGRTVAPGPLDTDALVRRVMDRLPEPTPTRRIPVRLPRRRAVLSAIAALLVVLLATPPVRAAVADWFGVIVRDGPPAKTATVPAADGELDLTTAAGLVGFDPVVPEILGPPDGIDVAPGERVMSMSWSVDGATIRLDQFEGTPVPAFVKAAAVGAEQIDIDGTPALWFSGPHHLVSLGPDGLERVDSARAAGPTLIWPVDGLTLRLEGADYDHALDVASGTRRR